MGEYVHILLHGQKRHRSTYEKLFAARDPCRVLVFSEQEELNPDLIDCASKHGADIERIPIESLQIPNKWTIEMIQSKPYTIISQMCDGIISQKLHPESVVVSIFSGSNLHQSMLLLVAKQFGFEIMLSERTNQDIVQVQPQSWITHQNISQELSKSQLDLLLSILHERLINKVSDTELVNPWRNAQQIVGSVVGGHAPKEEGFSVSAKKLITSGLLKEKGNDPKQYSLTGKGWLHALELWRENTDIDPQRPARIMGALAARRDDSSEYHSIRIANRLPYVEDWLPIFSRLRDDSEPGITLFDKVTKSAKLSEADQFEIDSIREHWGLMLASRDMNLHSWSLLDVSVDEMESQFSTFCDWIWPRLMSESGLRRWCMDITQFPNNSVIIGVLFAQALGIPITFTLAQSGHEGTGGKKVTHDVQNRSLLVIPLPDWKLINSISAPKIVKLDNRYKVLISLLSYEEEYNIARRAFETELEEIDPEDEELEFGMSLGISRQDLETWIDKSIENGTVDTRLSVKLGNTKTQNELMDSQMIFVEEMYQSRKHLMRLTPIGRIAAILLRERIL